MSTDDLEITPQDADDLERSLVRHQPGDQRIVSATDFQPVMSVEEAIRRKQAITQFVSDLMRKDHDYGVIPGTPKATLLKPGAERLCSYFGLTPKYTVLHRELDFTGQQHGGEAFAFYEVRCSLYRGGSYIAEADGSCSSFESKYRWRDSKRKCPHCKAEAIIRGKQEYGGGWLCFKKQGGCGAKFSDGDKAVESQKTGRVPNPDIHDQFNTILKMAEKRALIAATLIAVNASEFFTQDLEDIGAPTDRDYLDGGSKEAAQAVADKKLKQAKEKPDNPAGIGDMVEAFGKLKERLTMHEPKPGDGEKLYYRVLGAWGAEHANDKTFQTNRDAARAAYRELESAAKDWESRPSPEVEGFDSAGKTAEQLWPHGDPA